MIAGIIALPGDKSISHRAAMFSALADGRSVIDNFASSADCASTLDVLSRLGVVIERQGTSVRIEGVGERGFLRPDEPLDCGNSGTTMRLMTGILAGCRVEATLIGDRSLSSRPMKRVIEPLTEMGALIQSNNGMAPLSINAGRRLRGIEHRSMIASAQIKSSILLAGLHADGQTTVVEAVPTRDHTERMLGWFGAAIDTSKPGTISIIGGQKLSGRLFTVPGDISSAAFFLAAAACFDGSELSVKDVGLNPTRTGVIEILSRCGVTVTLENKHLQCNEPVGDITVRGPIEIQGSRERITLRGDVIANAIDEIPILAVLGTQFAAGLEIRDAGELRFKESDRISAVVENLRRMGAKVEEFPDGMRIDRSDLRGAVVDSLGDHRIAMAFAVAGLLAKGSTEIVGADCVDISFPGFFETLESVVIS